jgi:hypothetical protein
MKWLAGAVVLVVAAGAWLAVNPSRGFGVRSYGLTTFEMVPLPVVDFQRRPDGAMRRAPKTHDLTLDGVAWLVEAKPEVMIISTGWEGRLKVRPEVTAFLQGYGVRVLGNAEAAREFNRLIGEGKRVAIHWHSTC